ncbi:MAG: hypothetical protein ACI8Y4_005595, partial [Candidatus Poriferisodalaceae bacterium]
MRLSDEVQRSASDPYFYDRERSAKMPAVVGKVYCYEAEPAASFAEPLANQGGAGRSAGFRAWVPDLLRVRSSRDELGGVDGVGGFVQLTVGPPCDERHFA